MAKKMPENYATIEKPVIEAVVNELFRFETPKQAVDQLEAIRSSFITSREQTEDNKVSVRLWIKGYALTEDEIKEGYLGHFATIRYKEVKGKKIALYAEKDNVPLKTHPQKKRQKARHPNWGHPILRGVKKKKTYKTIEEAQKQIQLLHEEFPEVSIPCTHKMYVMIYQRGPEGTAGGPPVQKWVLNIKVDENGAYFLEAEVNKNPRKRKNAEATAIAPQDGEAAPVPDAPLGKFTAAIEMKRAKKKKK